MSERELRVGRNEALFRTVNERVRDLNVALASITDRIVIACECADIECIERIGVPPERYAEVRADPTLFIVRPGHEDPDSEWVVDRDERFTVVEKRPGLPKAIARQTSTQ